MFTTVHSNKVYFLSEAVWKAYLAAAGIVPRVSWDIETFTSSPTPPDPWAKVWEW